MSKELEAYRRLCRHLDYDNDDYMFNGQYEEDNAVIENALKDYETIKKDLDRLKKLEKVIEILKKALLLNVKEVRGIYYVLGYDNNYCMTKEEYELLKEVLENDK